MRCYDGSDQEFWRSFYRPLYELPLRYHAHTGLAMNLSDWRRIRLIHNIDELAAAETPAMVCSHCARVPLSASECH